MAPLQRIRNRALPRSRSRAANEFAKRWTMSQLRLAAFETTDAPSGRGDTHASYSGGAFETHTREPGLMPSFFHSGVPEYPLTRALQDASSTLHLHDIEGGLRPGKTGKDMRAIVAAAAAWCASSWPGGASALRFCARIDLLPFA